MMDSLLTEIRNCTVCAPYLEAGVNPTLTAHPKSRIIVTGQAPGAKVHCTGIPWDDKSGDNLRQWMDIDKDIFYDPERVALIPMGFCYSGKGKTGDLPPRKECAPLWHHRLMSQMKDVRLILLVGQYAQAHYIGDKRKATLTETVKCFDEYLPEYFVLPHPSPHNNIWQAKNPWFAQDVLPELQTVVGATLRLE